MLLSLSLILLLGFALSGIFNKLKLPGLLGMILTGILLGPYALNLIAPEILMISADLREIALIIILMRAGLSIDLADLKKVGRPAILMCFLPATFEIIAIVVIGPWLLGISLLEAAVLGTVLAAVSPAVIVPRMLKLMASGSGTNKSIPQLIMAGASVDDIYVIVLFTSFINLYKGEAFNATTLLSIPFAILSGVFLGIITGLIVVKVFKRLHMRDTIKVLILLSFSFLFVSFENIVKLYFPLSGLIAVMALGGTLLKQYDVLAKRLMGKFSKIWVGAEILLFVLVGAAVNIYSLSSVGLNAFLLVLLALFFRTLGVLASLMKTALNAQERLFCAMAYFPKATVQAAIGAIPLSTGMAAGNTILSVAVLAILMTAPLGAISIDLSYPRYLHKD